MVGFAGGLAKLNERHPRQSRRNRGAGGSGEHRRRSVGRCAMIRALATGTLYDATGPHQPSRQDPRPPNFAPMGKTALPWVSCIAFGEQAERLATLPAGAALSVSGRVEVSAWSDKMANQRPGYRWWWDEIATMKAKPKPRGMKAPGPTTQTCATASPGRCRLRRPGREGSRDRSADPRRA